MRARILTPTAENLARAAEALRKGELVAMPTETVYGLAGSAVDPKALASIFETKERPTFDPLIVHVAPEMGSLEKLEEAGLVAPSRLGPEAQAHARKLMKECWPGPLTLVLPKGPRVPDLATSGLPSVAIRVPSHPIALALLKESGLPLAAPSANRFGRISPTSSEDVAQELGERIDWILDGGRCEIGVESTVVAVDPSGLLALLRPGGTPVERIEAVTGAMCASPRMAKAAHVASIEGGAAPAPSPGMLLSHYAPVKPLLLLPSPVAELSDLERATLATEVSRRGARSLGLMLQSGDPDAAAKRLSSALALPVSRSIALSRSGSLAEAAQNLFSTLRELDRSGADLLVAEPCLAREGLGFAIADRLKRAAAGS